MQIIPDNLFSDLDVHDINDVFALFIRNLPGGVFRYRADISGKLDFVSDGMIEMLGCKTRAEFDEVTGGCFEGLVHPDDRERTQRSICNQIAVSDQDQVTYRLNRVDGKELWVDDRGHWVRDAQGNAWFYVTVVDITEKVRNERELKRASERLDIITALSNDVLFDIDCETGEALVYGDFESRFGRKPQQKDFVIHKRCEGNCSLDIHEETLQSSQEILDKDMLVDFELSTEGPDGSPIWYRYQSVVIRDEKGHPVRHIGRLLDTHDMMVRESQFRHKAEVDSLTSLLNRAAALNRIQVSLSREHPVFSFFLIDVDDFKNINDTYGHPAGDRVLIGLSNLLSSAMRHEDIVARLGGDEFAVFANNLMPGPALDRVLNKLLNTCFVDRESNDGMDSQIQRTTISVGVAYCEGVSMTFDQIYDAADKALYESKALGKSHACIQVIKPDHTELYSFDNVYERE